VTCRGARNGFDRKTTSDVAFVLALHPIPPDRNGKAFPAVGFEYSACNSQCAGMSAGAPLSLIKSTRNFVGWVSLAFRSTT
jgi:hypothetical protein